MNEYIHSNITRGANGHLFFAGHDTVGLANEFGTPAIFIDEDRIRARCREYTAAMRAYLPAGSMPLYASKALSCKAIYRIVGSEGMGTDIVSPGELYTALQAGFPPELAFFHGNNKTDPDIEYAVKSGMGYFVVDGEEELLRLDDIARANGVIQKILLRVSPGIDPHTHKKISTGGVDSKFGSAIATGAAERITALALALKNVELCGFHCHIGSQIFETAPFEDAVEIMTAFIAEIKKKHGFSARALNLGGGFGVRYVQSDPQIDITANIKLIGEKLASECASLGIDPPAVFLEPGRSIVADSGMTLYTVGSVKEIEGVKNYVSVDGGMTDNPRYTLYQSAYSVYLASRADEECDFVCSIGGRCCESGDLLQENVRLPRPRRGDILAVAVTGAYNYSMASNYNRVARPPVVLLSASAPPRLAVRRETYEDLTKCDM